MDNHGHKHPHSHSHGHDGHTHDEFKPGSMDISAHLATYKAFWDGTKYSIIGLAVLSFLLFIFRTHNG